MQGIHRAQPFQPSVVVRPRSRLQVTPDPVPGISCVADPVGLWVGGLLLATTNQMSLDVAVLPFLWVLPLCLYLLSFILCFDSKRWYVRPLFFAVVLMIMINAVRILYDDIGLGLVEQVAGFSFTLFVCCMCMHGELARLKPAPEHLTIFYFVVSIGGAVGGLFVAVFSPVFFSGFYEYPILLVACASVGV